MSVYKSESFESYQQRVDDVEFVSKLVHNIPKRERCFDINAVSQIENACSALIHDENGEYRNIETFDKKELRELAEATWGCYNLWHVFDAQHFAYNSRGMREKSEDYIRAKRILDKRMGVFAEFATENGCKGVSKFDTLSEMSGFDSFRKSQMRSIIQHWAESQYKATLENEADELFNGDSTNRSVFYMGIGDALDRDNEKSAGTVSMEDHSVEHREAKLDSLAPITTENESEAALEF